MKIDAIYDAPADLALRSVFADELQENGDPRGEFIALQIANADLQKQRALIAKHGKKWAGKLGTQFRELHFENGFFAGGMLAKAKKRNLNDPAWRLVTVLGLEDQDELLVLVEQPELVSLRGLYEIEPSTVAKLPRAFSELGIRHGVGLPDDRAAIAKLPLLSLALRSFDDHKWLVDSPAFRTITRLIVDYRAPLAMLIKAGAKAPALREIVMNSDEGFPLAAGGWSVRLLRDGDAFTRVEGSYRASNRFAFPFGVITPLEAIPPKPVKSIKLESARTLTLELEHREQLAAVLAKFTNAQIAVPWETPGSRVAPEGAAYEVHARGPGFLDRATLVTALSKLLAEAGQTYDKLQPNNGLLKKLSDPKQVLAWAKNKRCRSLSLIDEATGAQILMLRDEDSFTHAKLVGVSDTTALVEWFVRFVDLAPFQSAALDLAETNRARTHYNDIAGPAWLMFVGGALAKHLPIAQAKKLANVRATKHGLLIEAPEGASEKALGKLRDSLRALADETYVRERGYDLAKLVTQKLGGVAKQLGMVAKPSDNPITEARFVKGKRSLVVEVGDMFRPQGVRVWLREQASSSGYYSDLVLDEDRARTKAQIEAGLDKAVKLLADADARFEKIRKKR